MDWLGNGLIEYVMRWLFGVVADALDVLWGLLADTMLHTPDVTSLPQVHKIAVTSLGVVNTVYVLAFLWTGLLVMARGAIQTQHGPGELFPRLILGLIGANFAVPLCSTVITVANSLTQALTSDPITSDGTVSYLKTTAVTALRSPGGFAEPRTFLILLIGLIVAVLVAMLFLQWITRLGLLIIVVGISPLALALHGTPQTDPAAKLWWRTFLGTLATVVIQAVALHTALQILLSPADQLTTLGLPTGNQQVAGIVNLLIIICLLLGVLKVPGLMRRYVTRSSPGWGGQIMRVVLIQQLTRALMGRGVMRAVAGAGRRVTGSGVAAGWPVAAATGRAGAGPGGAQARMVSQARAGWAGAAYSAGRPIRPYTPEEIALGVDSYTRVMKARSAAPERIFPS